MSKKKRNKNKGDEVSEIIDSLVNLEQSVKEVAEKFGKSERSIRRIKQRNVDAISSDVYDDDQRRIRDLFFECDGNITDTAEAVQMPRSTVCDVLWSLEETRPYMAGESSFEEAVIKEDYSIHEHIIGRGNRRYFILTGAQNGAEVFEPFWDNLKAYAEYLDADIMVGEIHYNRRASDIDAEYDAIIENYLTSDRHVIDNQLVFCAEMGITATNRNPLSGQESYTQTKWGIFPHPRIALKSVANGKNERTKQIMTTGVVTTPKYLHHATGRKAEHHHSYGAILVEYVSEDEFYCRQLLGDKNGEFYDLKNKIDGGKVYPEEYRVKAITWADIHADEIDPNVDEGCFGEDGMLDYLEPRYQFFHDISDNGASSYHNLKSGFEMVRRYYKGKTGVEKEMHNAAKFLERTKRPNTISVVVSSNHDKFFEKWLETVREFNDYENAWYASKWKHRTFDAAKRGIDDYNVFAEALKEEADIDDVIFLKDDQPFMVGEIEYGQHGHVGANGSKGSMRAFTHMGPKVNIGHSHAAEIMDGVWRTGTSSTLDLGYNKGLSSWNHSHIITYENDKRAIITMVGKKWCADS